MEIKDAMQTSNTEKATTGNKFQEKFFEKVCYIIGDVAKIRNNITYTINVRGAEKETKSDVEVIFHHDNKTRFIFESTTSLRDDRFMAKDAQAEGIIKVLEDYGHQCVYCLVVPDDEYYTGKNAEKERHNNELFADKINIQRNVSQDNYKFLQMMFKESEALAFVEYLKTLDKFDIPSIIDVWRQKLKNDAIVKIQYQYPEMEQLSFFEM